MTVIRAQSYRDKVLAIASRASRDAQESLFWADIQAQRDRLEASGLASATLEAVGPSWRAGGATGDGWCSAVAATPEDAVTAVLSAAGMI